MVQGLAVEVYRPNQWPLVLLLLTGTSTACSRGRRVLQRSSAHVGSSTALCGRPSHLAEGGYTHYAVQGLPTTVAWSAPVHLPWTPSPLPTIS